MNKSRGFKNVLASSLAQIITISLGILIPRLVLVNLGSEANGLLNSVSNILTYMALLEAGVGGATLQALYRPISEDDKPEISRIMAATNYFYRRTGIVYFILVLLIASGYALFIDSGISRIDVFLVVFLAGFSGVLSYFFQGKFKILLSAEGKKYITTNIATITHVGVSISKIFVLLSGGNVVAVQSVYFVFNLAQMIAFLIYMNRHYAWVDYNAEPDFLAISQRKAVLVHQVSVLVFNNTDIMVLTLLATLKEVSVYSMYALIFGLVRSVTVITDGFVYALGQSFHMRERFIRLYDAFELYTMAFTTSLFCITRYLILPFLRFYTSGVNDINYIDQYLPWLFAVYFLLHNGRQSSSCLIEIAQKFEETKWRAALEAFINVSFSLILTVRYGIYGVLIGTIVALLYRTNDVIIYASKILNRSCLITYRRWLRNVFFFLLVSFTLDRIPLRISSIGSLILLGFILVVTIVPSFVILNSLTERSVAKNAFDILQNSLFKRFHK